MNKIKIFRGKDIVGDIFIVLMLLSIGYTILDVQVIGGIALMIGGLIASILTFKDDLKTVLYKDRLVVHKLFRTNTILLSQITSLLKERRAYGKYGTRECLIIVYTEPSGYGDKLVFAYNPEMHTLIEKQLSLYKGLNQ